MTKAEYLRAAYRTLICLILALLFLMPFTQAAFAEKDVALPVKLAKILTLDKKRVNLFVLCSLNRIFAANKRYKQISYATKQT
jgi:hypothetical protein